MEEEAVHTEDEPGEGKDHHAGGRQSVVPHVIPQPDRDLGNTGGSMQGAQICNTASGKEEVVLNGKEAGRSANVGTDW